ncbi:PD-(D/E)XK nuclease family protein [Granulicella sp. S190]|uniref:PD-(D/E)XK nuclease family protein n=1 Tax=Granulicella sp. S190 TaxID=1747226 RepID=UPI001C202B9E|nr:PD-(D/E)XK nuclease family protein [Granulicella sp. S190]
MMERGLSPVRRLAREAIAAEITARSRAKLSYLAPVAGFPGFARALARTLEDLRLNGITADELRSTGRSGPDLALLMNAYDRALKERKFADHAERCDLALECIGARSLLLVDLRLRTRREQKLVDALKSAAPAWLELTLTPEPGEAFSQLESLQRYVLTGEPVPRCDADDSVQIFSASGEALECVEIARRILRLAEGGMRFDQIAVFVRSAARHQPLLEEAFARAAIPAWYSRGIHRPDVSGRAFLALLRCAAEDLSAARFAEYLSLGQMPTKEGAPRPASRWERILSRASVISGLQRWDRRLHAYGNELKDDQAGELEALKSLRDFALPIVRELATLPTEAYWDRWLDLISDMAQRTLDQPASVYAVLEELQPMRATGPVTLADVVATLESELSSHRIEEDGTRYGAVFVGSLAESAGMCFEAVFVPGLNEGVFPKPVREDPLLLDSQRTVLGIEGSKDDTLLLRTAAATAKQHFVCSWSRIDLATGRERVPSFYAFEVAESAGSGELDVRAFEKEARDRSEAHLGWPAPTNSRDAIDAAEYDLSTLRPGWDQPQSGNAAWLELVNAHVHRALDARRLRWGAAWTWADGLASPPGHAGLEMEKHFGLSMRSYSPTRLEQYARCPYRFHLESILGLRTAERPAAIQRMDPGIRGEFYHAVQSRFYLAMQVGDLLPVRDVESALMRLEVILHDVEAEFAERYMPAIPIVWKTDMERIRGDLRAWLRHVAANETEWTPIHFEYGFENIAIDRDLLLQGRIDLIEQHISGLLRVTDHKTGKVPERVPSEIGGGEFLQPVLYAIAASRSLQRPVQEARLFYSTLRGNFVEFPIRLTPEARKGAESVLHQIDKALRSGDLPAAPRKDGCAYCDFLPICGPYEEERAVRKNQVKLRNLTELREQP